MLNCRVYPNGEFSIWEEKRNLEVSPPPEQPDYLGLSLLPNSHRVAIGMSPPPPERAPRGQGGITRLGARTVRNAAFLLQERYGLDRLSFLTCTVPLVSETAEYNLGREWAEIVRIFIQKVTRLLAAAGLPKSYVGCTEIQEKRLSEHGGLPLHLHLVFPGRLPFKGWTISKEQFASAWMSAVTCRCPEFEGANWKSATRVESLRRSAENYLGKYMTKGAASLSGLISADPGIAEFLPSAWWHCSLNLKRAIGKRLAGGNDSAHKIISDVRRNDSRVAFSAEVKVTFADGNVIPVAVVGKLSPEGRKKYCWRPGGIIGIDSDYAHTTNPAMV